MEHLPDHLILDILSRVAIPDTADLSRARIACRSFNLLSRHVRSLNLLCSSARYLRSHSPATHSLTTPFKSIVRDSVLGQHGGGTLLQSVCIRVEEAPELSYDNVGDDSGDDLYLTDVEFLREWLPRVSDSLTELSISDFWVQSCWRRSHVLRLVSSCCRNLLKLELKKTWLSVEGLIPLPNLTSLTLEFIRLDDEDLNKINASFPSLQVLNLLGVGGLKDPKIHLQNLKSCQWSVSNVPLTLSIFAPNLEKLKLRCMKPRILIVEAPLLSDFSLTIVQADSYEVTHLSNLTNLQLSSSDLYGLISALSCSQAVKNLTLNSQRIGGSNAGTTGDAKINPLMLFEHFPSMTHLTVGPGDWLDFESSHQVRLEDRHWDKISRFKELVLYLASSDVDTVELSISSLMRKSCDLEEVTILLHQDIDPKLIKTAALRLGNHYPQVKWKLGTWKEPDEAAFDPSGWEIVGQPQVFN